MSRPYDPTSPREIERLKKLFGLPADYVITVTTDDASGEHVADISCAVDYHSASIVLHRGKIEEEGRRYTDTSLKEAMYHEMAEIVAAECAGILPFEQYSSSEILRVRDRFADALKRTVMRLEKS